MDGAKETLKKIKAIFIEVSINNDFYQNSVDMNTISKILNEFGFSLVLLGTDINLTGNALYIKNLWVINFKKKLLFNLNLNQKPFLLKKLNLFCEFLNILLILLSLHRSEIYTKNPVKNYI